MKVDCPSCGGRLDADDLDLATRLGKCRYCGELISLDEILGERAPSRVRSSSRVSSNSEPQGRVERPFDARVTVAEEGGEFTICCPAAGFGGATIAPMIFAIPWLSFVAFWTAGASGLLFGEGPPGVMGILFPMFSIPFWLVGFGMLFGPIHAATVSRRVTLGRHEAEFLTRTLLGPRVKRFERADVQAVREKSLGHTMNTSRNVPLGGIEFVHRGGTYTLPVKDVFEKRWLLGEVWHALSETAPR